MNGSARSPIVRDANPSVEDGGFDWPSYVDTLVALHDLKLDAGQRAAVVRQMERIDALARTFMEFPLEPEVESAPVFRP